MNFEVNLHMRWTPHPFNKLENLGTFGYSIGLANLLLRGLLPSLPRQLTWLSSVRHNKLILLWRVSSTFSSQIVRKKCNFLCKIYFTSTSTSPDYVVIEVSVLLMFIRVGPTLLPPGGSELTDNKHLLLLGKFLAPLRKSHCASVSWKESQTLCNCSHELLTTLPWEDLLTNSFVSHLVPYQCWGSL